jgi:hypothetical protein
MIKVIMIVTEKGFKDEYKTQGKRAVSSMVEILTVKYGGIYHFSKGIEEYVAEKEK